MNSNETSTNDKTTAWKLHLSGMTTAEIADKLGYSTRWAQIAVKDMRDQAPIAIEKKAIKEVVKHLSTQNKSSEHIKNRIRMVFHKALTNKDLSQIINEDKREKPAEKKCTKCSGKPTPKFPRARCTEECCAITTNDCEAELKKEIAKLNKQQCCKCNTEYFSTEKFLGKSILGNAKILNWCKKTKTTVRELITSLTNNGTLSKAIDEGVKDGYILDIQLSIVD